MLHQVDRKLLPYYTPTRTVADSVVSVVVSALVWRSCDPLIETHRQRVYLTLSFYVKTTFTIQSITFQR